MRKIFHDYYEVTFVLQCRKRELHIGVFTRLTPAFHQHMELYPFSYLNRLFGLHRILVKRRYIYFFVMNNIFSTQLKLHRVFDLKVRGSRRLPRWL
jgi:hypothetical protein